MSTIAILGAGAGGLASVAELTRAGHDVRLWSRNPATLEPYLDGSVAYTGVLGDGRAVAKASTDLRAAITDAEVIVICLPALAHAEIFADLAALTCAIPVVLNPGHIGGALHLRQVFRASATPAPPVAELSTLTYIARKQPGGSVRITGRARQVRCGHLPGGRAAALAAAELFPGVAGVPDVIGSSLANVNLVLHPPGAILAAAWVEATRGEFTFYVDAMTPGVARVLESLDAERLAVAASLGHELPGLAGEMALIGSASATYAERGDTLKAIRSGEPNRAIKAPDSLSHRYYLEDFPFGIVPFLALAQVAGVAAPVARALLSVACVLLGTDLVTGGRDAHALGIAGLRPPELLRLVREEA